MQHNVVSACLGMALFLGLSPGTARGAANIDEMLLSGETRIVLENEHLRLVVAPRHSGRIIELVRKETGNNLIHVTKSYRGGVIEDHIQPQFYPGDYIAVPYSYRVVSTGPDEAAVRLWGRGASYPTLVVSKTVSLRSGESAVRIAYELLNERDDKDFIAVQNNLTVGLWVQNLVAGLPLKFYTTKDKGPVLVREYTDKNQKDQWENKAVQGWIAALNEAGEGLAAALDYKDVDSLYWCPVGDASTFEWYYRMVNLRPGESFKTGFSLIPFAGLRSVEGAGELVVSSFDYADGEAILNIYPSMSRTVTVEFAARLLPADEYRPLAARELELDAGKISRVAVPYDATAEGTHVLRALVRGGGDEQAVDAYRVVEVGRSSGTLSLPPQAEKIPSYRETVFENVLTDGSAPVAEPVETPHLTWAKPYFRGPLKVLFATGWREWGMRGMVELAQRLEMSYRIIGHRAASYSQFVRYELEENEYDVLVLANSSTGHFDDATWELIGKKLSAGMGLVYINPNHPDKKSDLLAFAAARPGLDWIGNPWPEMHSRGTWKREASHYITDGLPIERYPGICQPRYKVGTGKALISSRLPAADTPIYEFLEYADTDCTAANGDAVLAVRQIDKGRVVNIAWGMPRWVHDVVPDLDYRTKELTWHPWEYHHALLAKAVVWAAGKESRLRIVSLDTTSQKVRRGGEPGRLLAKLRAGDAFSGSARLRLRDQYSRTVQDSREPIVLDAGATKEIPLTFDRHLAQGLHLADLLVYDRNDKVVNWGSALFEVVGGLKVDVQTEDKEYEQGQPIEVRLSLVNSEKAFEATVRVKLTDAYDRLIENEHRKVNIGAGDNQLQFILQPRDVLTRQVRMEVEVTDDHGVLAATRQKIYFRQDPQALFQDYFIGAMDRLPVPGYTRETLYQLCRELGITMMIQPGYQPEHSAQLAASNMPIYWENLHHLGQGSRGPDEGFDRPKYYENLHESIASYTRRRGTGTYAVAYNIGEEMRLGGLKNESAFAAEGEYVQRFQEWLEAEYAEIQRLNSQWGTGYTAWGEIMPKLRTDMAPGANPSQWIDWMRFLEGLWVKTLVTTNDAIKQARPQAYAGHGCSGGLSTYDGWDLGEIAKDPHLDKSSDYPHEILMNRPYDYWQIYRTIFDETELFGWIGYRPGEIPYSYKPWWLALRQSRPCFFAVTAGLFYDGEGSLVYPTFALNNRSLWLKNHSRDLREGLGKILLDWESQGDRIGMLYSYRSQRRALFEEVVEKIASDDMMRVNRGIVGGLLRKNWFEYRYVSEKQLDAGALDEMKVLWLPYVLVLTDKEINYIEEFVRRGGVLIADLRPGIADEHGKLVDHRNLTNIMGYRSTGRYVLDAGEVNFAGTSPVMAGTTLSCRGREAIELSGAIGWARHGDGTPAVTVNTYGKGKAVYLNLLLEDTVASADFIAGLLAHICDVEPSVELTVQDENGQWNHTRDYDVFRFVRKGTEYLGIQQQLNVISPREKLKMRLAEKRHIYDVRQRQYHGHTDTIETEFTARGETKVFAALPYQVKAVIISGPRRIQAGGRLDYEVTVTADKEKVSDHVVHVEWHDPDGKAAFYHKYNLLAEDGKLKFHIPSALDAATGNWTLRVRDVASGEADEASIVVR